MGVSYLVISATFVSADITCNAAGLAAVNGPHYTRRSKAVCASSHGSRAPFNRPRYGRGLQGWEEEGDCNLIPASP